jgi:hypothetical protein
MFDQQRCICTSQRNVWDKFCPALKCLNRVRRFKCHSQTAVAQADVKQTYQPMSESASGIRLEVLAVLAAPPKVTALAQL